jgi:hypothetical protein
MSSRRSNSTTNGCTFSVGVTGAVQGLGFGVKGLGVMVEGLRVESIDGLRSQGFRVKG